MTTDQVHEWLLDYRGKYPDDYDTGILNLGEPSELGHEELAVIYAWKFHGLWPKNKIKLLREATTDNQAREITRFAKSAKDDLVALKIAGLLPGAKAAGASAVLVALDQSRFTVMDKRAIASLKTLGLWDVSGSRKEASYDHWVEYLGVCRKLAKDHRLSLREVDRALWAANGQEIGGKVVIRGR